MNEYGDVAFYLPQPLMPCFHDSVAVLPLPSRRCRKLPKNYVSAVRTTLREKNPLRRCRFHLPLHRNRRSVAIRSNPIFAILPLVDNQPAFWSLHPYVYGKTFPPFSPATATVATERRNGNGTMEQEWWKPGINERRNPPITRITVLYMRTVY